MPFLMPICVHSPGYGSLSLFRPHQSMSLLRFVTACIEVAKLRVNGRRLRLPPRVSLQRRTSSPAWWAHPDSNQGPTGYEQVALPLSYWPADPQNWEKLGRVYASHRLATCILNCLSNVEIRAISPAALLNLEHTPLPLDTAGGVRECRYERFCKDRRGA